MLDDPASVLHQHSANIILVEDPIVNNISSTVVRQEISQVTPQAIQAYLTSLKVHVNTNVRHIGLTDGKKSASPSIHWCHAGCRGDPSAILFQMLS